jgi:non-lysosomal glucosylceramidase
MRRALLLLAIVGPLVGCGPMRTPVTPGPAAPDPAVSAPAAAGHADIPEAAWTRPLGEPFPEAARAADVGYPLLDDGPYQGLPLGGLGSGSIGRTYRGDFARWHTQVGVHRYAPAWANQFSVYTEQGGGSQDAAQPLRQAHVLYAGERPPILADWGWDYPVGAGSYAALFPRAWYSYSWERLPVRLTQEQLSPVIPGNYRESSYPAAAFIWRAENPGAAPVTVSLMLTWENFLGLDEAARRSGAVNTVRREGDLVGIEMGRAGGYGGEPGGGSVALLAREAPGVAVSYAGRFPVDGSGRAIWEDFAADGALANSDDPAPSAGEPIAAALAVTFTLGPGEVRELPFALAWDQPADRFPAGATWYRRYTRFFGRDGDNAWAIAAETMARHPAWREQIVAWQRPILDDPARPLWYKTALFNELYYLVDGGTLWGDEAGALEAGEPPEGEMGGFAYLECFDYPFYATHDVAFYSSWAMLQLWPELERAEMLAFAATVGDHDPREVTIGATGKRAPRKLPGAMPHDLGAPFEDPLRQANAYTWQDINVWKDLNLKYVLRAYRDYVLLDDRALLDALWPSIPAALDYLRPFDRDGDGLLDHEGADQTYDTWAMEGASAYTGGLLIAALEAGVKMAELQGDGARAAEWRAWADGARASFEAKLWNGEYYDYDSGAGANHDSVMADQLAGQWYAGALGLPAVAPQGHIDSALHTIYELNVMGFQGGAMGAVNGMRPDGAVDATDMQSREVWSGVTYGLAALMLQEGLEEEGWRTAWGAYNVTYVTHGLWFRTPEAWYADGSYRASMYMRPQAIWAIEHALGR